MRPLIAILALSLAGCVSYSEMRAKPPMITAASEKSPDEVVGCIAPRWADLAQVRWVDAVGLGAFPEPDHDKVPRIHRPAQGAYGAAGPFRGLGQR